MTKRRTLSSSDAPSEKVGGLARIAPGLTTLANYRREDLRSVPSRIFFLDRMTGSQQVLELSPELNREPLGELGLDEA